MKHSWLGSCLQSVVYPSDIAFYTVTSGYLYGKILTVALSTYLTTHTLNQCIDRTKRVEMRQHLSTVTGCKLHRGHTVWTIFGPRHWLSCYYRQMATLARQSKRHNHDGDGESATNRNVRWWRYGGLFVFPAIFQIHEAKRTGDDKKDRSHSQFKAEMPFHLFPDNSIGFYMYITSNHQSLLLPKGERRSEEVVAEMTPA